MIKSLVEIAERAYAFEGVQNPLFQVAGTQLTCRSPAQHNSTRAKQIRDRIQRMIHAAGLGAEIRIQEGVLNSSRQHAVCITRLS